MSHRSFMLNGKHVLAMFLVFFAIIIIANAVFITFAVKSFPGEQEKKSYLQGVRFNDRLAEREAQNALGWTAEIATARAEDGLVSIELAFRSATNAPISGLSVEGVLSRPVSDEFDAPVAFEELAGGAYRASIAVPSGAWRLQATATNENGDRFELEKRLLIE